jgi:transcriptional regulator with XRE-family HTH domain
MTPVCTGQTQSQSGLGENVCLLRHDFLFRGLHNADVQTDERNFLREWRLHKGLTQEQLADKVGTTKAVISLLETEQRPLSSKWLRKFAEALGTTPGRILDVDPNEVSAEVLNIWDHIGAADRPRAVRILRSLTGTDD